MAFESIDTNSLRNAISACQNRISYHTINDLINNISSNNTWQTSSRDNLKNALVKLINDRYNALSSKLQHYQSVVGLIERYKKLQSDNRNYENEISSLNPRLYYTEYYQEKYYDEKGREQYVQKSRTVKNWNVQNRIDYLRQVIQNNNYEMSRLETQVSSSI